MRSPASIAEQLCLNCGLCCNGVLFKDVELQIGDDAKQLATLGLPLKARAKFPQPCAALCSDLRCRIYSDRPKRCRQFECALFKSVAANETTVAAALRTIQKAIKRAKKVRKLLHALGDDDDSLALSLRFKRARRRIESGGVDEETAETYAVLTLAVHDLNLLLAQEFYPGPQ